MSKFCFAAFVAMVMGVSAYVKAQPEKGARDGFPKRVNANAEAIKAFDKDGDGKLNDQERAAMREQMRKNREKMFDTNGDGKLDDTERAAMQEARKAQLKEFDKDGDGKLSVEERKAMRETLMKRHQGKDKAKEAVAAPAT